VANGVPCATSPVFGEAVGLGDALPDGAAAADPDAAALDEGSALGDGCALGEGDALSDDAVADALGAALPEPVGPTVGSAVAAGMRSIGSVRMRR